MSKRLWDKGEDVNKRVHLFTVGDDPQTDLNIVRHDILASAAHAKMLEKVGLLNKEELSLLLKGLTEILASYTQGNFIIPYELEDCHTTIEDKLTASLGEPGRKIHTGRSRNDQIMVAMRLYLREAVTNILIELENNCQTLAKRAQQIGHEIMPGYTHFQHAMPTSVAIWLSSFAESFLELIREGVSLLENINCNPLGVASGFGVNLPIEREETTKLLKFNRTQRNSIAVQNSRGSYELKVLHWCADIASVIEKFSFDLILYTTKEFGFFSLPNALTTGSSIMPQKHNPDVLELLRARASKIRGAEAELSMIISKLPSNYHRDFQYTKEPTIRGIQHLTACLPIINEVITSFTINSEKLANSLTPELFATYDAFREVKSGKPFRDAYKQTAEKVSQGKIDVSELKKDFERIAKESDADKTAFQKELKEFNKIILKSKSEIESLENELLN